MLDFHQIFYSWLFVMSLRRDIPNVAASGRALLKQTIMALGVSTKAPPTVVKPFCLHEAANQNEV